MPHNFSAERPYYTFDSYARRTFGRKLYRLALAAGESCPNRDGTAGTGGCIFCGAGAGRFAQNPRLAAAEQIERAKAQVCGKLGRTDAGPAYIAYFQSYTGTYAPLPRLRALLTDAAAHPDIAALSVATRPKPSWTCSKNWAGACPYGSSSVCRAQATKRPASATAPIPPRCLPMRRADCMGGAYP